MGEIKWPRFPPGEFLQDFMDELEMTPHKLAAKSRLPESCVLGILEARHAITKREAKRLRRVVGMSIQFWLRLQEDYDCHEETQKDGAVMGLVPTASGKPSRNPNHIARRKLMGEIKWPRFPPGEFLQDYMDELEMTPHEWRPVSFAGVVCAGDFGG